MASASDGLAATLSSLPDLSLNPFASPSERKFHLQLVLDNKEKQLQQAGALGQRVLAQQIELEEKIRHLQDFDVERGDDEDLDAEARERYRELADTIKAWDLENAQLSSAFGPNVHILPCLPGNLLQTILLVPLCFFPSLVASSHNALLRPSGPRDITGTPHNLFITEVAWRPFTKLSFLLCFHLILSLPLPLPVADSSLAFCRGHAFSSNSSQGSSS